MRARWYLNAGKRPKSATNVTNDMARITKATLRKVPIVFCERFDSGSNTNPLDGPR